MPLIFVTLMTSKLNIIMKKPLFPDINCQLTVEIQLYNT
jgi:hypothetical protein